MLVAARGSPLPPATSSPPLPSHLPCLSQGAHQRFYRQLLMAGKVDELMLIALSALDQGQCVVIGLQVGAHVLLLLSGWTQCAGSVDRGAVRGDRAAV